MSKQKSHSKGKRSTQKAERQPLDMLSNSSDGNELSLVALKQESDFVTYLKLIKKFGKRYTILIASYDTPYGRGYPKELSKYLMALGLKTDLYGKFRAGYAAVIDAGKVVFEQISDGAAVECSARLGNCDVDVVSTGYNSNDWVACIKINQKDYSAKSRGINFVVFDKITGFVLDSVGFDTCSDGIPCSRPSAAADFVRRLSKERSVSIVICKLPRFPSDNLTDNERAVLERPNSVAALYNYYDENGVVQVTSIPASYYDVNGVRRFSDYHTALLNTAGGHRVTLYQPTKHKRTIYMVGGCRAYGLGSDDGRTIESYLQNIFNDRFPDEQIIVQNYGFMFMGLKKDEIPSIIEALPLKSGDIVLAEMNVGLLEDTEDIPRIDISDAFSAPRNCEAFYDTVHYTPDGNRITAENLFLRLSEQHLLDADGPANAPQRKSVSANYGFDSSTSEELAKYKNILKEYYNARFPEISIGAVVMNCNPFTLGHRYLIEKALEQCDFLMIFVVQEDKSIFPFADRLRLVDECTADIKNKEVIPSGRFIISSLTFTEYFNKSELQDRTIDSSLDVTVFAREIAPCLHITKRFAGEEPNDSITRQYNETMARVLPEYGVEFVEIPRARVDSKVISASYVRELLEQKRIDEIRQLVPEPTYNYLLRLNQ